ncbi:MAG: NUDIX hydrolase [Gammaproteobacteria bacterium]
MPRRQIHRGPVIDLGIEPVTLPNGNRLDLEVIRHPGGAAVVALNEQQEVCLLHQYRHAADGWLWELPAGKIDNDEPPLQTAHRELAEEAGIKAKSMQALGDILTTPGFCDETIFLYLATNLSNCPLQQEADEVIEIHWLPFNQAIEQIFNGTIRDAKTVTGLLYAARHLPS